MTYTGRGEVFQISGNTMLCINEPAHASLSLSLYYRQDIHKNVNYLRL